MNDKMLLDGLFVLIALLFLPIGFRRGLTREVFVTAGVLAGAAIAASWARPWGADLADLIGSRQGIGQFAVSTAFIVGTALVLGYGGAAAAGIESHGLWSRIIGAALAVINGALISAFILRDIERFLADDGTQRSIQESEVARTLLRDFGWVIIGAALVMVVPIVIGLFIGRRSSKTAVAPVASWPPPIVGTRRKRRLGWGRDDGKVEPQHRGYDPAIGRYQADAPHYSETMPIAPVGPNAWSMDRAQGRTNGTEEWLEVSRSRQEANAPNLYSDPGDTMSRCFSCGERLTPDDAFCPRCGRARG